MLRHNNWRLGVPVALVMAGLYALVIWAVFGCTRTFVPSGKPGCPNATVWSDSAQRCIAREGR